MHMIIVFLLFYTSVVYGGNIVNQSPVVYQSAADCERAGNAALSIGATAAHCVAVQGYPERS